MFRFKTRRVKPPTRLFRLCTFIVIACVVSSCSLFKVYAGRVEYADSQHSFTMSVDTLHAERAPKTKLFQPIIFKPSNFYYYAQPTKTCRPL